MTQGLLLDATTIRLGNQVIARITHAIAPGEILTVMGPSGSGKSSLLAAVAGTLSNAFTQSGRVVLDGQDLTALPLQARHIGILFQDHVLFAHLSVGANLGFGLPASLRPRTARQARIEAALADVGLAGYADRDPSTLSGGQKARVALMRSLLAQPKALLLDEPFSGLDADLRAQVRELVFAHTRALGLPVILVTHDPDDARAAGGMVMSPLGQKILLTT